MLVMAAVDDLPDRYRDPRRLAAGGMATVHRAEDALLGRAVAIKLLHEHVAADAGARARFLREARAAARVSDHPHVVTIYDVGDAAGIPFIVMELMTGGSVADRMRRDAPIPAATALRWLAEAASALDHAHRHGIVHRDVKPANLMLDARGRLAVGDFGIARMAGDGGLTQTGTVLGTAAYLSPEQALGRAATAASDRYALAVVAFELLTGRRPFDLATVAAQVRAHVETAPPAASEANPALPPAVDRVLRRALDKDPDRRWPTATRMVAALGDALSPAPPPPRRRVPTAVLAGLAALLAGAAVAAFALTGGDDDGGADRRAAADTTREARTAPPPRTDARTEPDTPTTPPAGGDPSRLLADGHELIQQGRPGEAIPLLQQAVADCPVERTDPCAYALYDLGHALLLAGRAAEAIPVLEQRLANPDQRGTVMSTLRQAQRAARR
jgi:serine/threonine-protein kinase